MPFPFEVDFEDLTRDLDTYVDKVFACLESEFLVMPKGPGFVEYPVFAVGYEALKQATGAFLEVSPEKVTACVFELPMSLVVLRTMLGFTPSELAYVTSRRSGMEIPQGAARSLDRKIRLAPDMTYFPHISDRISRPGPESGTGQALTSSSPRMARADSSSHLASRLFTFR
jgi:hypothetical protein